MSKYPEHEKLKKIKDQSQFLGEFLDWCREENVNPLKESIQQLLARYFEIDLCKIDDEKEEMLDEIREINERV